jgi:hypothetical protein
MLGFYGIVGDSNTICYNESSTLGAVGDACNLDSDCLYNVCRSDICKAPALQCAHPTCSGHGDCVFIDISNNVLDSCTIVQTSCYAICNCNDGYGGSDCSKTQQQVEGIKYLLI